MSEDTLLPFDLPSVARKKLSVGFDGGQLSSDAGVLVLRGVEKKLGLAARLAACIRDRRKPERIQALSANQDLLVRSDWRGVDIEDLALLIHPK